MPFHDVEAWSARVRDVFERYTEPLMRRVAGCLYRPRGQWPLSELIERSVSVLSNDAVIDRRLETLDVPSRKLLALMAHSKQPRWKAGNLIELLTALGHAEGMRPILALMDEGLLYPEPSELGGKLKGFEQWMCQAGATGNWVFTHPSVMSRALMTNLELPECPGVVSEAKATALADGLDWPLRLAAVWQQAAAGPFRQTQQGEFFKRDFERIRGDALLNAPMESPVILPDAGLLATALARLGGVLQPKDTELRAGNLPPEWEAGLFPTLEWIWARLPHIDTWNCVDGWRDLRGTTNPYPSAYLLVLLLLARLPEDSWADPTAVEDWVLSRHPYWSARSRLREGGSVLAPFLLGLAHQLGMTQAAKGTDGSWVVRLSDIGRWLLGVTPRPTIAPAHSQTLLVQPNLEIVAYRQGLTPALISALSRFAAWKAIGPACTLQLQPDTVYRALESGWNYETILQTLEQHATRPAPPSVLESLRTWANKRERLQVYSAAALFEFNTSEQAEAALARGLPGIRLSERILLIPNENSIDYRHFRLIGTRDYSLPPDQCVDIGDDGVTLTIDPSRSDLLLETELRRFAEPADRSGTNGRLQYRLTPASLATGRGHGLNTNALEEWFAERTGRPLPPAARLLLTGPLLGPCEFQRPLVLHVETPGLADGLMQWPSTRALIQSRLGPTALVVAEENVEKLGDRLRELGLSFTR